MALGPCAAALGFTTGLWLAAARVERVVRGAGDDPTVRDWLAAVNDGVPANAVVEIPEDAGPLILIVMQDPRVVCPCNGCCFKLLWFICKNRYPTGQASTAVGVVRSEDGSITKSVNGRGWSVPVSAPCTVLTTSTDKGVMVSLHLGSLPDAVGEASLLDHVLLSAIRSIHLLLGKKGTDDIVRSCGLGITAQSEHDRAGQSTHSRGTGDTEGGGAWPSFSWLVVPFRHVTPVLRVHASPSHMVSALSFVSASFILRRHQCLCFPRGMVPVPTVGLRASQFGTASEVSPGELATHRHFLTHFHNQY